MGGGGGGVVEEAGGWFGELKMGASSAMRHEMLLTGIVQEAEVTRMCLGGVAMAWNVVHGEVDRGRNLGTKRGLPRRQIGG